MRDDPRADRLRVTVRRGRSEGVAFRHWTRASIERRIDAAAGSFQLSAVPGGDTLVPIRDGDEVEIAFDGYTILNGIVDGFEASAGPEGMELRIAGRDRAAQLVDCSPADLPTDRYGRTLAQIAAELAEPLGIELDVATGAGGGPAEYLAEPFLRFSFQPGEPSWAALERACRARGVLAYSNNQGALRIARPGVVSAAVTLRQGDLTGDPGNVRAITIRSSAAERFSLVVVEGQAFSTDELDSELDAFVEGRATDEAVGRYRPLVVVAEGPVSFSDAQDRAAWETTVRAARSGFLEVEVADWLRAEGLPPWREGELVPVIAPRLDVDETLLIERVNFSMSDAGIATTLRLVRPGAYLPKPTLPEQEDPVLEMAINPEGPEGDS